MGIILTKYDKYKKYNLYNILWKEYVNNILFLWNNNNIHSIHFNNFGKFIEKTKNIYLYLEYRKILLKWNENKLNIKDLHKFSNILLLYLKHYNSNMY